MIKKCIVILLACLAPFFIYAQDTDEKKEYFPPASEIIPFGTHGIISVNYGHNLTFDPGSISKYFEEVSGETLSCSNPAAIILGIDAYIPLDETLFVGVGTAFTLPLAPVKGLKEGALSTQKMELRPMIIDVRFLFKKEFIPGFSGQVAPVFYMGYATGFFSDTGGSISRDIVITPGAGWGIDAGVQYFPLEMLGLSLETCYSMLTVPIAYRDSYSASGTSAFILEDGSNGSLNLGGLSLRFGILIKLSAKTKEDF